MALTKKEFLAGDKLPAEHINAMQDAIIANENNKVNKSDKPTGTYDGNSSAEVRSVTTGAVGSVIFIWSSYGYGFVTPAGGVFFTGSTSQTFSSHDINYNNGTLYITNASDYFNGSNYTYNYQCL